MIAIGPDARDELGRAGTGVAQHAAQCVDPSGVEGLAGPRVAGDPPQRGVDRRDPVGRRLGGGHVERAPAVGDHQRAVAEVPEGVAGRPQRLAQAPASDGVGADRQDHPCRDQRAQRSYEDRLKARVQQRAAGLPVEAVEQREHAGDRRGPDRVGAIAAGQSDSEQPEDHDDRELAVAGERRRQHGRNRRADERARQARDAAVQHVAALARRAGDGEHGDDRPRPVVGKQPVPDGEAERGRGAGLQREAGRRRDAPARCGPGGRTPRGGCGWATRAQGGQRERAIAQRDENLAAAWRIGGDRDLGVERCHPQLVDARPVQEVRLDIEPGDRGAALLRGAGARQGARGRAQRPPGRLGRDAQREHPRRGDRAGQQRPRDAMSKRAGDRRRRDEHDEQWQRGQASDTRGGRPEAAQERGSGDGDGVERAGGGQRRLEQLADPRRGEPDDREGERRGQRARQTPRPCHTPRGDGHDNGQHRERIGLPGGAGDERGGAECGEHREVHADCRMTNPVHQPKIVRYYVVSGDVDTTATALRLGANRLSRRLRAERSRDALSTAKLAVLADLYRGGDQTAGALAAAQRVQPQSLTRVLASLQDAGLIARRRDPADRRQARLTLTAAGATALAADMAARDAWLSSRLNRLSDAQRALLRLAGELMEQLAAD